MNIIKQKAQEVVRECERQERLQENVKDLRNYKGEFNKYARIDLLPWDYSSKNTVHVRKDDLTKEEFESILVFIEKTVQRNLYDSQSN